MEVLEQQSFVWLRTIRNQLSPTETSVVLRTNGGSLNCLFHPAVRAKCGVVFVGGGGGGLDGPARRLYPAVSAIFQKQGISALRVDYRFPSLMDECVLDALLGVEFLKKEGCTSIALVGHSFGGAVVISAGAISDAVKAVVPMSTQTYGTDMVALIAPRPILFIHGTSDEILPDRCSRCVFAEAHEPKEIKLFPGARHGLDEVRDEVMKLLVKWIPEKLKC